MMYKTYHVAQSIEEALSLLLKSVDRKVRFIAGGTDLMLQLRERIVEADMLVDISVIPEMKQISQDGSKISIGAVVSYSEMRQSDLLKKNGFLLVEASKLIGATQIQNMGTIGGNIGNASPAGDILPCLYALDAEIALQSADKKRSMPLRRFITGYRQLDLQPGELISGISFEALQPGMGSSFVKFGARQAQAISIVSVAAVLQVQAGKISRVAIALGSVAPTIVRSSSAEELLLSEQPSPDLFEKAGEAARDDISPIDDIRGSAAFRRYITQPLVSQALETAWRRTQKQI